MANCVLCDIIAGRSPASTAYQDEACIAFMDIQPVNPGHVLVVPTAHATCLADLAPAPHVGGHMFTVAQRLAAAMRRSEPTVEAVNLFLADASAAPSEPRPTPAPLRRDSLRGTLISSLACQP